MGGDTSCIRGSHWPAVGYGGLFHGLHRSHSRGGAGGTVACFTLLHRSPPRGRGYGGVFHIASSFPAPLGPPRSIGRSVIWAEITFRV